jgi:hypothetical protein
MKYLNILLTTMLLTGCAITDVALTSADKPEAGVGTLKMVWLLPNTAEIQLDGKRYAGEWADSRCFTPECRGEFRNITKLHRRHIRKGSAELVAKDNTRLNCGWVSHDKEVIGSCQADDGRKFKLSGA